MKYILKHGPRPVSKIRGVNIYPFLLYYSNYELYIND